MADCGPSGRLRLDAVARYLQDVAADDVCDAGLTGEVAWVVRRTVVEVRHWPGYDDDVDLATWCSGAGAAWAERRTRLDVAGRTAVEATALWVSLDPATMRPAPLGAAFVERWGVPAGGRGVRTRLTLARPGPAELGAGRPWALRSADVDLLGHVNNAVAWVALEDELGAGVAERVRRATVEYRAPIEPGTALSVTVRDDGERLAVWLWAEDGTVRVGAEVLLRP